MSIISKLEKDAQKRRNRFISSGERFHNDQVNRNKKNSEILRDMETKSDNQQMMQLEAEKSEALREFIDDLYRKQANAMEAGSKKNTKRFSTTLVISIVIVIAIITVIAVVVATYLW